MEEVYRSSKWWEVKDWDESVSELMIGGRVGVFMDEFYRSSKWWEVKDSGESVSELMVGMEGGESLRMRFIGVVSDEKWRTGMKVWVN